MDCDVALEKAFTDHRYSFLGDNSESKTLCGNKHKIYFRSCISWLLLLSGFNIYHSSRWILRTPVLRHLLVRMHWTKSLSGKRGAGQPCHSAAESCCEFSSQIPPQLTELPTELFPLVKCSAKNPLKGHIPIQNKTPIPSVHWMNLQINPGLLKYIWKIYSLCKWQEVHIARATKWLTPHLCFCWSR